MDLFLKTGKANHTFQKLGWHFWKMWDFGEFVLEGRQDLIWVRVNFKTPLRQPSGEVEKLQGKIVWNSEERSSPEICIC